MKLKIQGRKFEIIWTELEEAYGTCDSPDVKNRKIHIHKYQSEQDELKTLIHELIHLHDWKISEAKVDSLANFVGEALYKLKYRRY